MARVEIQQTGLLLTQLGETAQLRARAFDADGNEIDGVAFTWNSSRASAVAVDNSGKASTASTGSSQIVANSGPIRSAPLLVVAARPPAGTTVLSDEQIAAGPAEAEHHVPNEADSATYAVVLSPGVVPPAIGSLVIGSGSKPVAGRVRSVATTGGQAVLVLRLTPMNELLPELDIDEVLDLSNASVSIPEETAADYDVKRTAGTFEFTRKPMATSLAYRLGGSSSTAATTPKLIQCKFEGTDSPIALELPLLKLAYDPQVQVKLSPARGFEKLILTGAPEFTVDASATIIAAFEGEIECKTRPLTWTIPIGGWLSFFLGGVVETGFGIQAKGKFTIEQMKVGTKLEVKRPLTLGLECPSTANCQSVIDVGEWMVKFDPEISLPGAADYLQLAPSVSGFGFANLKLGAPALKRFQLDLLSAKSGLQLEGNFSTKSVQILDETYSSNYAASIFFDGSLSGELENIPELLGISRITAAQVKSSIPLGRSPIGSVVADRTAYEPGDHVGINVTLNTDTVNFINVTGVGGYNVDEIVLVRSNASLLTTTEIARKKAADGQTNFSFDLTTADFTTGDRVYAFVVTRLASTDWLALELGHATVAIKPSTGAGSYSLSLVDYHLFTSGAVVFTMELNCPGGKCHDPSLDRDQGYYEAVFLCNATWLAPDEAVLARESKNWFAVFGSIGLAEGGEYVVHHRTDGPPNLGRPAGASVDTRLLFSCNGSFGWAGKYGKYDESNPDFRIADWQVVMTP